MLEAPRFHHLHLNSLDPAAAVDFYVRTFPVTWKVAWGGFPAVASTTDALILFTKVTAPPPTSPQSAIWHFGWNVVDTRKRLEEYRRRPGVKLLPLYTTEEGGFVHVSSDTWPGAGGVLGRTKEQIEEAKATGVEPARTGGFAYLEGPDGAIVEYAGNYESEYFNHIHFWQEQPFCAQMWYQQHLLAGVFRERTLPAGMTEANCTVTRGPGRTWPSLTRDGMFRTPSTAVAFGDVALIWFMNQSEQPLVSSRGQLYDHFALAVTDLDAWIAKLRAERVTFLEQPYKLGDTRAVMIEGPSREALELVEIG